VSALCLQTSCATTGFVIDGWIIGAAIVVALYVAVRLVLRHYFPPDTPRLRSFLGVVPLLPGGISRREYAVVYLAGLSN
jgi:hypothetical protein